MNRTKTPIIISSITFIAIFVVVIFIDSYEQNAQMEQNRKSVLEKVETLKISLENSLNSKILLTQGLIAYIGIKPNITQKEFEAYARELYKNGSGGVLTFQLAKDNVISHIYPKEGHEQVFGLNLAERKEQRAAITRAIQQNSLILAGPIELIQGGKAFISRGPVFLSEELQKEGYPRYWGLSQVMLDAEKIFEDIRRFERVASLKISLQGKDAKGADGEYIYGAPMSKKRAPITLDIRLPNGSWLLHAHPQEGWIQPISWSMRLIGISLAILAALLMWLLLYTPIKLKKMVNSATSSLKKSEERWELAVMGTDDGIWDWDMVTKSYYFSPRWKSMLGYDEEEISTKEEEFFGRIHPKDIQQVKFALENHFKGKSERFECDFRMQCKGGRYKWVRSRGKAIFDKENLPLRMLGANTDITTEKEQEELIFQQSKMAALGEMLEAIGHQWKQPLSVLSLTFGSIESIYRPDLISGDDKKLAEYNEILNDGMRTLEYMNETINDFSNFFKPDKNSVEFNIFSAIDEVAKLLKLRFINHFVELSILTPKEERPFFLLKGATNEFKQVLVSIFNNAIEAIESARREGKRDETIQGKIVVDAKRDEKGSMEISIMDNGGGIKEAHLEKIFLSRFTTKEGEGGSGIGLYLTKMIINNSFNGEIEVRNSQEGAEFIIRL